MNGICNGKLGIKNSLPQKNKLAFGISLYDEPDKRRELKDKINNSSGRIGDAIKRVVQTSVGAGAATFAASTFIHDNPMDAGVAAGLSTLAVTSADFIPFNRIVQRACTDTYDTVDILEKRGEVYHDYRNQGHTPQLSRQKANTAACYRLKTIRDVEKAERTQNKDFSESIPVRFDALMAGQENSGDYTGKPETIVTPKEPSLLILPYSYQNK